MLRVSAKRKGVRCSGWPGQGVRDLHHRKAPLVRQGERFLSSDRSQGLWGSLQGSCALSRGVFKTRLCKYLSGIMQPVWPCLTAQGRITYPLEISCNPVSFMILYSGAPKGNFPHCPRFSLIYSVLAHYSFPFTWSGLCSCKQKDWCPQGSQTTASISTVLISHLLLMLISTQMAGWLV